MKNNKITVNASLNSQQTSDMVLVNWELAKSVSIKFNWKDNYFEEIEFDIIPRRGLLNKLLALVKFN